MPGLVLAIIRQPRGTVLHVHVAHAFVPEASCLGARIRGLPLIATIHSDAQPHGTFGFLVEPYKRHVLGRVLRRCSAVIVLTEEHRSLVRDRYRVKDDAIAVIPNASDYPVVQSPTPESSTLTHLLTVGRLSPEKNVPMLLRALKILVAKGHSVRLTVVGEGVERKALEDMVEHLGIEPVVDFTGWLTGDQLVHKYDSATIVVQTSLEECFSLVLLEGMSRGKPIVATNILGTRDIIHDGVNGLLVGPNRVDDLVDAIERLAADKELAHSLAANALRAVSHYSWDVLLSETTTLYKTVAGGA
jgi:phosphatidylinositol alpha-mannosyltransferase